MTAWWLGRLEMFEEVVSPLLETVVVVPEVNSSAVPGRDVPAWAPAYY